MLSEEQEQALVSLCNRFITSGEDVGLAHLIDLVNSTIPNRNSSAQNPKDFRNFHSAPSILDLLNSDHIDSKDVDIAAVEDQLFNHLDPYDLEETEHIDPALQERVFRLTTRFDIADYIKLDDPELKALITKVDSWGPGVSSVESVTFTSYNIHMGKPGDWSVVCVDSSFLQG